MEKEGKGIPGRRDSACKDRCTCLRVTWPGRHVLGRSVPIAHLPHPLPKPGLVPLAEWASPQVVELQQTLAQKDQALGKLEQNLRLMEEASFDGTFLWKITNVTRRCHESACGRTVSLFSPGNTSPGAQRPTGGGRPHWAQETSRGSSQLCESRAVSSDASVHSVASHAETTEQVGAWLGHVEHGLLELGTLVTC